MSGSMSGEVHLLLTPVGSVPEELFKCGTQRFSTGEAVGFGDGLNQVLMRQHKGQQANGFQSFTNREGFSKLISSWSGPGAMEGRTESRASSSEPNSTSIVCLPNPRGKLLELLRVSARVVVSPLVLAGPWDLMMSVSRAVPAKATFSRESGWALG